MSNGVMVCVTSTTQFTILQYCLTFTYTNTVSQRLNAHGSNTQLLEILNQQTNPAREFQKGMDLASIITIVLKNWTELNWPVQSGTSTNPVGKNPKKRSKISQKLVKIGNQVIFRFFDHTNFKTMIQLLLIALLEEEKEIT